MPIQQGFDVGEGLPTLGRWSVRFKPETPAELRNAAFGSHADEDFGWAWDTICFTPARIRDPGIDRSTLLSKAVFSGMIENVHLNRTTDPWQLSGPSVMAWLGNGSSPTIGPRGFGPYTINNDFATIMVALFSTAGDVNGMTLYSAATCSGNTISDDTVDYEVAIETIKRYMRQTTTKSEMWVRPDFGVHFAAQGNAAIFAQTPEVMFTSGTGIPGHAGGLFVIPGAGFEKVRSVREHAFRTWVVNPGVFASGTSSNLVPRYAADGTTSSDTTAYYESSAPAGTGTEENTLLFDRHRVATGHFELSVSCDVPCILSQVIPGDWVYLHDPDTYTYDTANEVLVGGRLMYPVALRVAEVDMPVSPDMGVYRLANSSADPSANAVVDLSDWVIFEQSPTRLRFDTAGWSLRRLFRDFPQPNSQTAS